MSARNVLHLPQTEIPGVIKESARNVLNAHGFRVVGPNGEQLTAERYEQLLRELGNNTTACLYSVDQNPENW